MLRRKIDDYLLDWLGKNRKKTLIVEGPRQVGKTYSIKKFITNHYADEKAFYIDFKDNYSLGRIFKRDFTMRRIYQEIQLHYPEKHLIEKESIIFFDNIQLCPEIIPYFKTMTEDGLYDIVASGSSLGIIYGKEYAFPVGYVDRFFLGGLDFEEYLWAAGYDSNQITFFKELNDRDELRDSSIHEMLIDLFREYMAIGGMPEVVSEYLIQNNFKLAFDVQRKILDMYIGEMEIHSKKTMFKKIVDCFDAIPMQLFKDNKKFQYRLVSEKGRATVYEPSVNWLIDSGLAIKSQNVVKPIRPLHQNAKKDTFKLYLHDPGLLVAMYGENTQLEILKGNLLTKNGAVLENTVASLLHKNEIDLYYFERNSTLDIDFILTLDREITPLLVKEADNTKSKALKTLEDKYGIFTGLKLSSLTTIKSQDKNLMPVYMIMTLSR